MNLTSSQNEIFANAFRLGVGIGNMLKLCEIQHTATIPCHAIDSLKREHISSIISMRISLLKLGVFFTSRSTMPAYHLHSKISYNYSLNALQQKAKFRNHYQTCECKIHRFFFRGEGCRFFHDLLLRALYKPKRYIFCLCSMQSKRVTQQFCFYITQIFRWILYFNYT